MKKIFYFIASAIVALGAVACQNDINENIAPESEGLSFTAEVEMTRITIGDFDEGNGYPVVWQEGDDLDVTYIDENEEPVTFTFTFNGEKFVCEEENVNNLVGKIVSVNYYASDYGFDSKAGKAGMCLGLANGEVTFVNGMNIELSVENSFFHFSSSENVVLTVEGGDYDAFCYNDELTASTPELTGEDIWVPFYVWAGTVDGTDLTLTASIDGEVVKQITRNFANGKIYNLGTIEAEEVVVPAEKLYLVPNNNWKADNAWFAAYFFNAASSVQTRAAINNWVKMTDEDADGVYECEIPKDFDSVIFCRMANTATEANFGTWDGVVWTQTDDLTISAAPNNYCYIIGWDECTWQTADYEIPVPAIGVVGSFQGWDVEKPVAMTDNGDGWIVANGVELYKDDAFKFVEGNSWDVSYGGNKDSVLKAEIDTEYTLVQAGGQDIKVTKNGKFDIYFNPETKAFKYTVAEEYTNLMVNITINNKANWSPLYITLKNGDTTIVNNATVTDNKYAISGDYIGEDLSYTLSNGSKNSTGSINISKTGATITLEETVIKLKITLDTDNSKQWWGNTMKIHVWDTGTSFDTTWPGNTMTSEGNYTWSIVVPSELVGKTINFLVNNGGNWKSNDSKVTIKAEGNTLKGSEIGIN